MEPRVLSERRPKTLVDENVLILASLPATIFLHNVACFGFWSGLAILSCYLAGVYCCRFIERERSWSSMFFGRMLLTAEADVLATSHAADGIEEDVARPRQHVLASRPIDRALDQIFCRIADQYISTWYSHISSDAWFQFEVRSALRRIVCSVYDRIARVNLEHFALDKVIPICLAHATSGAQKKVEISRLHVAVHSRKSEVMYVQNLSKCVLKFLLPAYDLNCRSYAILLREIVSKSVILSLSDAICNPRVLNQLILRHLEMKDKNLTDNDSDDYDYNYDDGADRDGEIDCGAFDKPIQLLRNFVNVYETSPNNESLRPDLNAILKDKELQNTFMRYLKSHNAEHVLQFCLDIASFNEKILKPELEADELDDLYRDAWDLFSVYFSSYSPNCIHFHKDLASPLRKALSKDILKLRTTATLFEAYEYAFSILENRCQDFHNSAEFYRWLYGRSDNFYDSSSSETVSTAPSSSMLHCVATKESFGRKTMAEIGQKFSRIKDALKADSVLEGRTICGSDDDRNFSDAASEAQERRYTEVGVDVQLAPVVDEKKKINNWKISIPNVASRSDPATNTVYAVFVVQIIDESDKEEWLVQRRPVDVHSLYAKLAEFYGKTLPGSKLPAVKFEIPPPPPLPMTTTTSMEDARVYEEYLKKLVGCVELNDSPLLYNFFTLVEYVDDQATADASIADVFAGDYDVVDDDDDDDDDDPIDDSENDDEEDGDYENDETSLSKIFRESVVPTLRKERGQNLETFVSSLINSCVTTKHEWKEVGAGGEKKSCHKKTNSAAYKSNQVYGNNFDVDANATKETVILAVAGKNAANFTTPARLTPFSLLIHAAYKIYHLRTQLTRILVCFECAFGKLIDQLIFKMTRSRLKQIAMERNVAYFINTIEWAVFDNKIKYNEHRVRERVKDLLAAMSDDWLFTAYHLIFQTLQDAKKNKQLFYNLCDVLMEELFPEIFASTATYASTSANE